MDTNSTEFTNLERAMWSYADAFRGRLQTFDVEAMLFVSAYLAFRAQKQNKNFDLEDALEDSTFEREFIVNCLGKFDGKEQDFIQLLAQRFTSDELKAYVLHHDIYASDGVTCGVHGTPESVVSLARAILDIQPDDAVMDCCCGLGNLLSAVAEEGIATDFFGIEINPDVASVAKIRMDVAGVEADIVLGDLFNEHTEKKYNKVFANCPFAIPVFETTHPNYALDLLKNEDITVGKSTTLDWFYNLAAFEFLAPGGKIAAIMRNGALINSRDKQFRKYFIDNNMIEAVVALPGRLFRNTAIPTALLVLAHNEGPVRLVDASNFSISGRRWDTMGPDEIAEVVRLLSEDDINSKFVTKEELAANEYSLLPQKYLMREVDMPNPTPLGELALSIERGAGMGATDLDKITTTEDTGMSYLKLADIQDGIVGSELTHILVIDPKLDKQCLKTGDLVISKNGAPFKIAVVEVPEGQTILANGNLYIVKLDEARVDPYYVAAFLLSEDGKAVMNNVVVGTSIPTLPLKNLQEIKIPLRPMEEQKEIAETYKVRLDEIVTLRLKLEKARNNALSTYDEVTFR